MAEIYEDPDIQVDSEELADEQFAYIEENFDGWTPSSGQLDTWILECGARLGSEVGTLALIPPPAIWRTYGEKIVRFLPIDPTPATALSTWVLDDADGHTIEAGTVVSIEDIPFEVTADRIVPPGQTTAEGVELVATEDGSHASGLSGAVTLEDSTVGYTATIGLDAPTSGGSDGETDEEYADRLAVYTELFKASPDNAESVEKFARLFAGIDRVLVLENYRPPAALGGEAEDVALVFTVCPIDESGQAASAGSLNAYITAMAAARGLNRAIYSINPTYTVIDVNFTAVAHAGHDPATVLAAAIAAIEEYLSPANWGNPLFGERQRRWVNTPLVRYAELYTVLNNVEGLNYVTLLEFGAPGALATDVDFALAGKAALPQVGSVTGDVDV